MVIYISWEVEETNVDWFLSLGLETTTDKRVSVRSVQVKLLQNHPNSVTSVDDVDQGAHRSDLRPKYIFHCVTLSAKRSDTCDYGWVNT